MLPKVEKPAEDPKEEVDDEWMVIKFNNLCKLNFTFLFHRLDLANYTTKNIKIVGRCRLDFINISYLENQLTVHNGKEIQTTVINGKKTEI